MRRSALDRLEGIAGGRGDRTVDQAGRQPRQHPVREAVKRRRQRWIARRGGAQRIEGGGEVPVAPDALGQIDRADDLGDVGAVDDPAGGGGELGIRDQAGVELGPRRGVDRGRVLAIPVEQLGHVGRVDTLEVVSLHGSSLDLTPIGRLSPRNQADSPAGRVLGRSLNYLAVQDRVSVYQAAVPEQYRPGRLRRPAPTRPRRAP